MTNFFQYLRKVKFAFDPDFFKKTNFFQWLKCAFISLKYVDDFNVFPSIQYIGDIELKIFKDKSAKLIIDNRLIIESWLNLTESSTITLSKNSIFHSKGNFIIGNGVTFYLDNNAKLLLKGRNKESASGITAKAVIMVKQKVEIGEDCIIAWDTFITDCDWHSIKGKSYVEETIIGNHVWLGVGTKILKGAKVQDNCIVTSNSVVLKGNYANNSLISGAPAKVVKNNIEPWCRDMKTW